MVMGMVLSGEGRPVCCELWPGNTTDVKTLLPVVQRLRERFGIEQVCVVADRGMISDATVATLEDEYPGLRYILGARLRSDHEVRDTVLAWPGALPPGPWPAGAQQGSLALEGQGSPVHG